MFVLDNFKTLEENAEDLFPGYTAITSRTFDMAQTRYFNRLRHLDYYTKNLYFNNTYFSKGGICCFILKELIYFTFIRNGGSLDEEKYYGMCNRIFNF